MVRKLKRMEVWKNMDVCSEGIGEQPSKLLMPVHERCVDSESGLTFVQMLPGCLHPCKAILTGASLSIYTMKNNKNILLSDCSDSSGSVLIKAPLHSKQQTMP